LRYEPDSRILDVGCGCGRIALAMLDFLEPEGTYVGFDVSSECIDWCVEHIEALDRRFHFEHVDVQSASYNSGGAITAGSFVFPYADASFGGAFVSSVFTHMEEGGIDRYLSELGRVIAPGGTVLVSLLLVNSSTVEAVNRETTLFSFNHRLGPNSWTIDQLNPLDGVGISEAWFLKLAPTYGFRVASTEYGNWREVRSWAVQHDWLCLRRAPDESAA
jgi:ubiquinone/menaquinone biosynthesis C-methylase UbiE